MVTIDHRRCGYCGGCVSLCLVDAIELDETRPRINGSHYCGLRLIA